MNYLIVLPGYGNVASSIAPPTSAMIWPMSRDDCPDSSAVYAALGAFVGFGP